MPIYTFGCADCESEHELMLDLKTAQDLELVCTECGGPVRRAPVFKVNIIGPAIQAHRDARNAEAEAIFKPCGHRYQCRCGVRLSKPNPFKREIKKVHGFGDQD